MVDSGFSEDKKPHSKLLLVAKICFGVLVGCSILFIAIYFFKKSTREDQEQSDIDLEKVEMDKQIEDIGGASQIEKIARVGREYLFITDLEKYAYFNLVTIEELDREEAIFSLVDNSVLLQAAENKGWVELTSEIFNSPFKDITKRSEVLMAVRDQFRNDLQEGTQVEYIGVWFYNGELGQYAQEFGLEPAKEKAKEKIDEAYKLVTDYNKTMEEAAQIIIDDTSLEALDSAYQINAYDIFAFPYSTDEDFNEGTDNLRKFLETANEGDVSQIYLEKDTPISEQGNAVDAFYAFYKVKRKVESFDDVEEWIEDYKQDIKLEIY